MLSDVFLDINVGAHSERDCTKRLKHRTQQIGRYLIKSKFTYRSNNRDQMFKSLTGRSKRHRDDRNYS